MTGDEKKGNISLSICRRGEMVAVFAELILTEDVRSTVRKESRKSFPRRQVYTPLGRT